MQIPIWSIIEYQQIITLSWIFSNSITFGNMTIKFAICFQLKINNNNNFYPLNLLLLLFPCKGNKLILRLIINFLPHLKYLQFYHLNYISFLIQLLFLYIPFYIYKNKH